MFTEDDYLKFIDMITSDGYKRNRMEVVSYIVGRYGFLSSVQLDMIDKAFLEGYITF